MRIHSSSPGWLFSDRYIPAVHAPSIEDQVWDRAVMEAGGPTAREGDRALSALLSIHGIAMNGGLLHSVMFHDSDQLDQGIEGFRYFGLTRAAEAVAWLRRHLAASDLDAAEELEVEAERWYDEVIPTDATLVARFEAVFLERPDAFAPLA